VDCWLYWPTNPQALRDVNTPNPHLTRTIEYIELFQTGKLSLTNLWKFLELIPSVLESSVPSHIRTAIQQCANELEIAGETMGTNAQQRGNEIASRLKIILMAG
jgi:hypothetical protein